jgi:probable phosphoglycerate mutase
MNTQNPLRIVLWRHGQTDWNIENRFQGHTDIPLNNVGKFQIEHAAKILMAMNPVKIISSDLKRTQATANALATICGLSVITEKDLRETHGGQWEGRTGEENRANDGDNFLGWLHGADIPAGSIGERRSEVAARARRVIEREVSGEEGTIVFVTHGGTARCVLGSLLELPIALWSTLGGLSNASWSVLEKNSLNKWFLAEHNAGSIPEPNFGNESES